VELQPLPIKKGYYHLLKMLAESEVSFEMVKRSNKIKEEIPKAVIYLNDKQLSSLYE
jgi:hypothetical protein